MQKRIVQQIEANRRKIEKKYNNYRAARDAQIKAKADTARAALSEQLPST